MKEEFMYYEAGSDVWVALDARQIKSAVSNAGSFDPNNPDITR